MRYSRLILLLVGLCAVCGARSGSAADLRDLIRTAVANKQRRAVIPPGVYRMAPEAGSQVHLSISKASNLDIVADGVTMVCTRRTRALQMDECENVTLQGLTIDYDPLTFTQGRVIGVGEDKSWIDVKVDAGYPRALFTRIEVYDPKTRFHKRYVDHLWGAKCSWKDPDVIHVTRPELAENIEAGDLISLSAGPEKGGLDHGVVIAKSANTTFRGVTVHCAPGMGIVEGAGEGGTSLLNCKVAPGPKPAGATQERLLSTSWDAILHSLIRKGPRVEGCTIENAGDDSWSISSPDYLVLGSRNDTLTIAPRNPAAILLPGDRLRRFRGGPEVRIREVRPIEMSEAGLAPEMLERLRVAPALSRWRGRKNCLLAELDRPSPFQAGDSVYSPESQGDGFIYRNNRIHSAGRGALLKAACGGIIENNLFWGGGKAVCIAPELTGDSHAGCAAHVIIRNNTIRETGYHNQTPASPKVGAITLSATSGPRVLRHAGAFEDIAIENNVFEGVRGLNIGIISAKNVRISGNRFLNTHWGDPGISGHDFEIDTGDGISISESDDIAFSGNEIEGMGPFAKGALYLAPSVRGVSGTTEGLRIRPGPTHSSSLR